VVACLPNKSEALSSNPNTTKKKKPCFHSPVGKVTFQMLYEYSFSILAHKEHTCFIIVKIKSQCVYQH
jgi:hypothetical protein